MRTARQAEWQGGHALDSQGVALIGALVIPKPVLSSVGKNHKRGAKIFSVSPRLFFGVVGVEVGSFRFQDAKRPAFTGEHVIGASAVAVEFKTHAAIIEEVPAAVPERLVDQDAGKCLGFWHGIGEWIIP